MTLSDRVADPSEPLELAGCHVHFVGIGGCGMSGLARMAKHFGAACSGSDLSESPTVLGLRKKGIGVVVEQAAESVPADAELIVVSAAIKEDHPERVEAQRRGLPVLKYAQMLGRLMIGRCGVAMAGTHGKSSTTSMLAHTLIQTEHDPSFIIGAHCEQIGGGARVGETDILLAEACEYDRSFHNFHPTHGIILNVEADHLDLYSGIEEIVEAFAVFARRVPQDGSLLIQHEMSHRLTMTAGLGCKVETIGFAPQADWRVEVISKLQEDRPTVRLSRHGDALAEWAAALPGDHMAYNAAVAAVTAYRLGADWAGIAKALTSFKGLDRRMQHLGQHNGITVIDDYGHHPTEIETTLRALRRHHRPRRLVCVFQPHQHSRTRFFLDEFATSFGEADIVIVPEIYFVRDSEAEREAVTAGDLVDRLRQTGVTAMHLSPFGAIVEQLQVIARPGDLLVTMGAGDVWKVAREFLDHPGFKR